VTIKGPLGSAMVYQGQGHDWILEFYPRDTRKHRRKTTRRVFNNSAKQAAVIVAKQLTGVFQP
jgi:hypothetical protein